MQSRLRQKFRTSQISLRQNAKLAQIPVEYVSSKALSPKNPSSSIQKVTKSIVVSVKMNLLQNRKFSCLAQCFWLRDYSFARHNYRDGKQNVFKWSWFLLLDTLIGKKSQTDRDRVLD